MKSWEDRLSVFEPNRSKTEFVFLSHEDEAVNAQRVAAFFVSAQEAPAADEQQEEELWGRLLNTIRAQEPGDRFTCLFISDLHALDAGVESDVEVNRSVRTTKTPGHAGNQPRVAKQVRHLFDLTAMSPMDRPNIEPVPLGVIDEPGQFGLVVSAVSNKFWMFLRAMRYASGLPHVWSSRGLIPDRSCPMLSALSRRLAMT